MMKLVECGGVRGSYLIIIGEDMALTIDALIESRRKSIAGIQVDIDALKQLVDAAATPSIAFAYKSIMTVKMQRMAKLKGELEAFEASRKQVKLPGVK